MIFNEIHFISGALGMHTSALVLLPDYPGFAKYGSDGKSFKALYLLHGLSDDETIWMRRTSLRPPGRRSAGSSLATRCLLRLGCCLGLTGP